MGKPEIKTTSSVNFLDALSWLEEENLVSNKEAVSLHDYIMDNFSNGNDTKIGNVVRDMHAYVGDSDKNGKEILNCAKVFNTHFSGVDELLISW